MGKKYRFVWGKNGFCGAKKIMAIDDVKKVKTHDEPKVSNFRVYYEPPEIIKTPTKSVGGFVFRRITGTFLSQGYQYVQRCKFVDFYDGYATVNIYKQV